MAINEIDNNGKSKIIKRKIDVSMMPNHGIMDAANMSAPSHNKAPLSRVGHAKSTVGKKILSDHASGGKGMKGSY